MKIIAFSLLNGMSFLQIQILPSSISLSDDVKLYLSEPELVMMILETGFTIGGKSLREHFEVINHRDAINYVENLVASPEPFKPLHVRQIHKLVLLRIDDENAGQVRATQVRIAGAA